MELTNLLALNEQEADRYKIYKAISERLPHCKDLDELKQQLLKHGIETVYKYKGQTQELQGISFKIGEFKYKGSDVDRNFSIRNLERSLHNQHLKVENETRTNMLPKTPRSWRQEYQATKEIKKDKSLLEELMKPEQRFEQLPTLLLKRKKRKIKKSTGL